MRGAEVIGYSCPAGDKCVLLCVFWQLHVISSILLFRPMKQGKKYTTQQAAMQIKRLKWVNIEVASFFLFAELTFLEKSYLNSQYKWQTWTLNLISSEKLKVLMTGKYFLIYLVYFTSIKSLTFCSFHGWWMVSLYCFCSKSDFKTAIEMKTKISSGFQAWYCPLFLLEGLEFIDKN